MDFNRLYLKKKNRNSGFKVFIKSTNGQLKAMAIKSPKMNVPFGVEMYADKEIVNLEFTGIHESNEMYNFHVKIQEIDRFFSRISYDPKIKDEYKIQSEVLELLTWKEYINSIKIRKDFEPLLRTHLKKRKKIINSKIYKDNKLVETSALEEASGILTLILDSVWIKNGKCGLVWLISEGKLE